MASRPRQILQGPNAADHRDPDRAVRLWLYGVALLIALTAIVGAATRLTGSGLSITEWNLIGGIVPPLGEAQWQAAFEQYRQIPQYREINRGMGLAAFKAIFWWEWGHRLLGRGIGAAFALPLLWFLWRRRIRPGLAPKLAGLLLLGGLQGAVGWWMVKSGLVERTDVSQYRLAAHLGLAVAIFALILWVALDLRPARAGAAIDLATVTRGQRGAAWLLMTLVFVQVLLGALVAGLKAGRTHNTWPLMDGALVPAGLLEKSPWHLNVFENATTVQFNHRVMAYAVVALAVWHAVVLIRSADAPAVRRSAALVAGVALGQTVLGIWTLLAWVPLSLGVLHQAGALAMVAATVAHLHALAQRPVL